jgi:hypothetical protein
MSDNINAMNFKQLRNEVQSLRDELAIMKRKYEDIIYNLDTDNFSQRVVKQGKDMYSKIEQTAEEISLQAEKITDNETKVAELSVTAEGIKSEVSAVKGDVSKNKTLIEQTANSIESTVESVVSDTYIKDKLGDEYLTDATFRSNLLQDAYGIYSTVSAEYETKDDANSSYSSLSDSISSVRQKANSIQATVGNALLGKYVDGKYTIYTQTNDTFSFDGLYMDITSAIRLSDNSGNHAFSIFHDQSSNSPNGGIVYMWGAGDYQYTPIVIGNETSTNTQGVYLYSYDDDSHIATRGWVLENAGGGTGGYAVFG